MTQQEALDFAREYLLRLGVGQAYPTREYRLNGQLQYRLCVALDRLRATFNEVTRKDVALLVEAWVMAQAPVAPKTPILHESQFDDGNPKPP